MYPMTCTDRQYDYQGGSILVLTITDTMLLHIVLNHPEN
ncbi:hypothetical protein BTN49_1991 [Candidatus Enterovibrio escicola]|uniref:Uncharacterized protein n=1 Tax=Candidatus Enterovibrio escicola TaxID=1927127 RepID=A0A2A5T2N4_9GAMM|nr:hypothetical protein BTN49_1991 [Candidatus Enterovibrio escacola]